MNIVGYIPQFHVPSSSFGTEEYSSVIFFGTEEYKKPRKVPCFPIVGASPLVTQIH
jgi:hypothetical protein